MNKALKKPLRAKKRKAAADKARFEKLAQMGCIVCRIYDKRFSSAQIHHIKTGMGRRKNHQMTIPLCPGHHVSGYGGHGSGLSIHGNKNGFETYYSTEAELLAKVNALLEMVL